MNIDLMDSQCRVIIVTFEKIALTVGCRHSPVGRQWAADEEKRQLRSDKAERNVDGDIVDPFALLQSLGDTSVNHQHASLAAPDAKDKGMFRHENPFTTSFAFVVDGRRHGPYLLRRH